jgi:uncharacterized membrane protein
METASVRARHRALLAAGNSTERLEFFSDAVFAIAMTLLVLDLRVPALPAVPRDELGAALLEQAPKFFAYVLSFAVIALNWSSHFRRFQVIDRVDRRLVQLDLLLLLLVAFVPFPTAVLSEYGPEVPGVVLYAATVALINGVQCLIWVHAKRAGLLSPRVDRGLYRFVRRNILLPGAVFTVSIGIALLGQPLLAMLSWLAISPSSIVLGRANIVRPDELEPAVGRAVSGGEAGGPTEPDPPAGSVTSVAPAEPTEPAGKTGPAEQTEPAEPNP